MSHKNILDISRTALLVVDVQEAFRNVIGDFAHLATRVSIAIRAFQILERPIFVAEQYPKGLGRTAEEITSVLPTKFHYIEKTAFSSCGGKSLTEGLRAANAQQIVVGGLETHVCVNQTVHDLLNSDYEVHILTDCIASRFEYDKQAGLSKMMVSGAVTSSVEMALFELMRDSRHEKFKDIQSLVK